MNILTRCLIRNFATKARSKIIPDETILNDINNELYKPRNHPGIMKPRVVCIPDAFTNAAQSVVEDYPVAAVISDGIALSQHLKGKHAPMEQDERIELTKKVQEKIEDKLKGFVIKDEKDEVRYKDKFRDKVTYMLKQTVYNWKSVNYDAYTSLVYLFARAAPEFAVLTKIFTEVSTRDVQFTPKSLFDFGSGVGTVTWAANSIWKKPFFEYFNVDSSVHMNDLAQILLQGGRGTNQMPLKGVFYRQFLPTSNVTYDLVVSAYSLLELPSRQTRLETIVRLWNKTQKYLVLVEQGTNAGFQIINEARDFILHTKNRGNVGHVFSPCPHDAICPRFTANDETPCNFEVAYFTIPIGKKSERRLEKYSYVVIKKGERDDSDRQWPRIVRETLVRSKHTICRMCTKNQELQEVIFTSAKHGKSLYHCARSSKWGDLVPVDIENQNEIEENNNDHEICNE